MRGMVFRLLVGGVALATWVCPVMAAKTAPPLPAPPAGSVYVSYPWELTTAMNNLTSGQTIVLNPGVYDLGTYAHSYYNSGLNNVTIRGATNDPNDVVIKGSGMSGSGSANYIFQFASCSNVLIANLTLRDVYHHLIHLTTNVDNFHI